MTSIIEVFCKRRELRKCECFKNGNSNLQAVSSYDGDLSFTLEGVTIRIPNSELVVPEKYIDKVTGERKENTTKDELVISPLGNGFNNANDVAIMGRLFFSMAYLSINQDAGTFTVWPVEDSFSSGTPSIKALSPENNIVEDFCDGENPPASNGTETRQPSNEKKSSLSGAALGGIVLGGLAFIAAILALILFFLRGKKRANKGNRLEGNEGANSSQLPPYRAGQYYDAPSEMPASAGPAEAPPLTTKYAYNLELEAPTQPQELDGSHGRAL